MISSDQKIPVADYGMFKIIPDGTKIYSYDLRTGHDRCLGALSKNKFDDGNYYYKTEGRDEYWAISPSDFDIEVFYFVTDAQSLFDRVVDRKRRLLLLGA